MRNELHRQAAATLSSNDRRKLKNISRTQGQIGLLFSTIKELEKWKLAFEVGNMESTNPKHPHKER